MASTKNDSYFPALTGIRAIAAYMVFIYHYTPFTEKLFGKTAYGFFREFHVGVNLFFVLSGFLIAYRYYDGGKLNFKKYMVNRIARIYPVYFLLTTLTFIIAAIAARGNTAFNFPVYLSNITFIRGFFDDLKFTGISQGWSLTVEETFYLLAPLFFLLIKRTRIHLVLLPLLFVSAGFVLVRLCRDMHFYGLMGSNNFMYVFTFFGRCFEFFIGIGLALLFKRYPNTTQTSYKTYTGLVLLVGCIFLLSAIRSHKGFGTDFPLLELTNNLILPLLGIAVFYYGLLTEQTLISKLLSSKAFVLLGKSSYVFYLIQAGFIELFLGRFTKNHMLLFLPLVIISILIYKYVEEPLNLYIRRKASPRSKE